MEAGLLIILVGTLFLLKDLGLLVNMDWGLIWPLIIIMIGLSMVSSKSGKKCAWCWGKKCDHCDHRG